MSRKAPKSSASGEHAPARGISSDSDSSDRSETGDGAEPKRRRRIVNRDPNRPPPKAWSVEEVDKFKSLIQPLGAACGGCHLGKGGEGGKFRFPKEG